MSQVRLLGRVDRQIARDTRRRNVAPIGLQRLRHAPFLVGCLVDHADALFAALEALPDERDRDRELFRGVS